METQQERADALERFERMTAIPMMVLALAIIPLLVIPLVWELPPGAATSFLALDWFIWAAFAVEYGIRLYLAPQRWFFVRHNVIDLIVVVVPFLRPLRVARSMRMLRLLRASYGVALLGRASKAARRVFTENKLHYALLVSFVVVVAAALLVMEFEREAPDATIISLPDALWWAVVTLTTVGYGDEFPTTAAGRGVGVVLMLLGIALLGFLAASLASYFIGNREEEKEASLEEALASITETQRAILERLDQIERAVEVANGHIPNPEQGSE